MKHIKFIIKYNDMKLFTKRKDVVLAIVIVVWLYIDIIVLAVSYLKGFDPDTAIQVSNMAIILVLWILLIKYLLTKSWRDWCNK